MKLAMNTSFVGKYSNVNQRIDAILASLHQKNYKFGGASVQPNKGATVSLVLSGVKATSNVYPELYLVSESLKEADAWAYYNYILEQAKLYENKRRASLMNKLLEGKGIEVLESYVVTKTFKLETYADPMQMAVSVDELAVGDIFVLASPKGRKSKEAEYYINSKGVRNYVRDISPTTPLSSLKANSRKL